MWSDGIIPFGSEYAVSSEKPYPFQRAIECMNYTFIYSSTITTNHSNVDTTQILIQRARFLYAGAVLEEVDLDNTVYALDSTTIDLCLEVFWWAKFRKHKAAIKLHTLFDVRCQIPCFIHITDGLSHDVNVLDILEFEAEAFYVMDRGYLDWSRLYQIHQANAFFVTRAKDNMAFVRVYSHPVDKSCGLKCDQTIRLKNYYAAKDYPAHFRRIKIYDKEQNRTLVFITNNLKTSAIQILSVSSFDKTPVNQLFTKTHNKDDNSDNHNQLILYDF